MSKKLLIAALAVAVGLGVAYVASPKFGSLMRLKWRKIVDRAEAQVAPETEIERLRMELERLSGEDRRFVDQIVRLDQQVDELKGTVTKKKSALASLQETIRERNGSLVGESKMVSYKGGEFSRADMREQVLLDIQRFDRLDAAVKAEDGRLTELTKTRDLYQKRLEELRTARAEMRTELQRLENALLQERQAQIANKVASDDGGLARVRQDMNKLKQRVDTMKRTRELEGVSTEEGPIDRAEKAKQRQTELEKRLQDPRFAPRPASVSGATSRD